MRIGIDARVLDRGITGTGRYLMNLLCEIPKIDTENEYFLFTNSNLNKYEKFYKIIDVKNKFLPSKIFSVLWPHLVLPFKLKKHKIDIYFTPNIILPLFTNKKISYIPVLHDIIPLLHKTFYPFSYRTYLKMLLPVTFKKADLVITVSSHSKKDIVKYFNLPESKVDIVYANAQEKFKPISLSDEQKKEIIKQYNLPKKYVLYVGAIDYRKNISCIIKTAERLKEKNVDMAFVLIGKCFYSDKSIFNEIEEKKEYIRYINFMDDNHLPLIYNMAFCFLFPSYYEGFGIPPLEAMQSAIPTITSNNSSLPEVVGDGGILVDADDYISIADEIEKLYYSPDVYNSYKVRALEASKKYSAQKSTKKLVEIFNNIKKGK